ncbi:MAG: TIGR03915 family putative DNA repair protein [Prevotella sp.]|jgi:probable DNA metabolism protein|nr:TIGR03915 family putative DNA repair protein [Prevotella sp.]
MTVFRYDKTFEGLLSAVFDAYSRKIFPEKLIGENDTLPLFAEEAAGVVTQPDKSARVWAALEKKLSKTALNMLWAVWLSETEDSDNLLFRYICKTFDSKTSVETNFNDSDVLKSSQIAKMVNREAEYIRQFARFQKAADNMYFAPIAPKCNALPFAVEYFTERFADQQWLVYDMKRKYGFYYDLKTVVEITLDDAGDHLLTGKLDESLMAEDEKLFQKLWQGYFKSLTIKERINPKLHRQNLPVRFWKYLTEKGTL